MRTACAAIGLLLSACAGTQAAGGWIDVASLRRATPDEGYSAVVLYRSDRFVVRPAFGRFGYTEIRHHEVVQVLTEQGVDRAEVKIRHRESSEIRELRARSVDPDGTVRELQPEGVLKDVASKDAEDTWKVEAWRVPGVKPGSILEYAYTIHHEAWYHSWWESAADDVPVRLYKAEVLLDKRVRYALRTYNAARSFERGSEGDFAKFTWTLEDVPPVESDDLSPNWTVASPWWIYRLKQVVIGDWVYDGIDDWADALKDAAEKLSTTSDLYDEAPAEVGKGCADLGCRIDAAIVESRKVPLRRSGSLDKMRKLSEVRSSGFATSYEKTMVLLQALRGAGVQARPAVAADRYTIRPDPKFPWGGSWNHSLVYVPPQPGLTAALFLDPLCDRCSRGQITGWLEDTEATVLDAQPHFKADTVVTVERVAVTGAAAEPGVDATHYALRVDPTGKLSGTITFDELNHRSIWQRATNSYWTEKDWDDGARDAVTKRAATGRVLSSKPGTCEEGRNACSTRIDFEVDGYATAAGDRLVVPLGVMRTDWDSMFQKEKRSSGIVVRSARREEDELTLEIPAGYTLAEAPQEIRREAPGFIAEVEVRREPGKVVVLRRLVLRPGIPGADSYAAHRKALTTFQDVKKSALVLTKNP